MKQNSRKLGFLLLKSIFQEKNGRVVFGYFLSNFQEDESDIFK
jgi:hypothetical protein